MTKQYQIKKKKNVFSFIVEFCGMNSFLNYSIFSAMPLTIFYYSHKNITMYCIARE